MRTRVLCSIVLLASCADRIGRPTANAGQAPPAAVAVGVPLQLDGSASTDPQDRALSFAWSFTSLPPGSAATFADATVVNPSFVPDVAGSYVVSLVVSNDLLSSAPAVLTIEAGPCGVNAPVAGTPVATPANPAVGHVVQLSAPEAADADNADCALAQTLSYSWTLVAMPAGSVAALSDTSSPIPSFAPDLSGDYVVALTVTDSTGLAGSGSLTITAGPCGENAPSALVGTQNPAVTTPGDDVAAVDIAPGEIVQLDASASSDADETTCSLADPLTYAWSFDGLPPGSTTALNSAETNPSFVADVPGTYRVRLTVTDSTGRSDVARLSITADPCVPLLLQTSFACATVRSGNAQGLNAPQGVTVDDTGAIYVVNNGDDSVVRIVGGSIGTFARGGLLGGNAEDIVFDPGTGSLFVTDSADDEILQLEALVPPVVFSNAAGEPRSIDLFTDCGGQDWLVTAAFGDDRIRAFDPTDGAPAGTQWSDLMTTGGGNDLAQQPRGVAGACLASADRIFATHTGGNDGLIRDTPDIAGVQDAAVSLSGNPVLFAPRDVVLTPCATPKAIVAASGTGSLVVVDNCGGGGCAEGLVATGFRTPWGLWFENATTLLVTDRDSNTLFRLTGDFCSL